MGTVSVINFDEVISSHRLTTSLNINTPSVTWTGPT